MEKVGVTTLEKLNIDRSFVISLISWVLLYFIEYAAEYSTLDQEFILTAIGTWIEIGPEILQEYQDLSSIKNCMSDVILQCFRKD